MKLGGGQKGQKRAKIAIFGTFLQKNAKNFCPSGKIFKMGGVNKREFGLFSGKFVK